MLIDKVLEAIQGLLGKRPARELYLTDSVDNSGQAGSTHSCMDATTQNTPRPFQHPAVTMYPPPPAFYKHQLSQIDLSSSKHAS